MSTGRSLAHFEARDQKKARKAQLKRLRAELTEEVLQEGAPNWSLSDNTCPEFHMQTKSRSIIPGLAVPNPPHSVQPVSSNRALSLSPAVYKWCSRLWLFIVTISAFYLARAVFVALVICTIPLHTIMCARAHPVLVLLGIASICIPAPALPDDPFATARLSGLVVNILPKVSAFLPMLSNQTRDLDTVWSSVHLYDTILVPQHGKRIEELGVHIQNDISEVWEQSVYLGSNAQSETLDLAQAMQLTAAFADMQLRGLSKHGLLMTLVDQFFTTALPIRRRWLSRNIVITACVAQIDKAISSLDGLLDRAEGLRSTLESMSPKLSELRAKVLAENERSVVQCAHFWFWSRPVGCRFVVDTLPRASAFVAGMQERMRVASITMDMVVRQIGSTRTHMEASRSKLEDAEGVLHVHWDVEMLQPAMSDLYMRAVNLYGLVLIVKKREPVTILEEEPIQ